MCTELARSEDFGKIKRRRCCGPRAKVPLYMSYIFVQQGNVPFKDAKAVTEDADANGGINEIV